MEKNPAPSTETPTEVTDDLLRKLDENPAELAKLPKALRDKVMAIAKEQSENPIESPDPAPETATLPAVAPDPTPAPEAKKPLDLQAILAQTQSEANLANKAEQALAKLQKQQARRKDAQEKLAAAQTTKVEQPKDHLGEEHQSKLAETVALLQAQVAALVGANTTENKEEIDRLEAEINNLAYNEDFSELKSLQEEYPDVLKTAKPLEKLNEEYATWLTGLVEKTGVRAKDPKADENALRAAALDAWTADKALQEAYKPIEEMDKLNTMLTLYQQKVELGGSIEGHWLVMLKKNKVLDSIINRGNTAAAQEATRKTVEAITKPETTILSPSDGNTKSGDPGSEMTPAMAKSTIEKMANLQREGGKMSPAMRIENRKAIAVLAGQQN